MTTTTTPQSGGDLTKVSVNMNRRAVTAYEITAELTGLSRTDVINRAVQVYALVEKIQHDGGRLLVQDASGKVETLDIL